MRSLSWKSRYKRQGLVGTPQKGSQALFPQCHSKPLTFLPLTLRAPKAGWITEMDLETGESKFLVLKTPLPPSVSANILGRVVQRYDDLLRNYTPESPTTTLTPAQFDHFVVVQHRDDAHFTAQASSTSSAFAGFFARASASTTSEATATVTGPRVTTRQLQFQTDYLTALKANPAVRRKLLDMCPVNETVYLVVGTMSARSAKFERWTLAGRNTGGGAKLPVRAMAGAAALAAGVPLVTPDLEAGLERSRLAGVTASFIMEDEDEQVFAVACRVIKRTWRGLGNDLRVGTRQPEYTGGLHFGSDSDSDDSEDEEGFGGETGLSEADEIALAEEFELREFVI